MLGRRRGRPGLLGTVGRTAAIVGTAQVTANAVNARSRGSVAPPAPPTPAAQQPVPAPPLAPRPTSAGGDDTDLVGALSRLAQLRDSGALTDAEFDLAKSRILA